MTRSSFATPPPRASRSFPTRYAGLAPARDGYALEAGRLYRFVLGLDHAPRPMTPAEAAQWLNDPLATLVLRRGVLPQTLDELLAQLDRFNADPEGVPVQASYLVGDGSQIPWTPESGAAGTPVRAVYEVPTGHGFVVCDVRIGGRPIEFGAQIADFINMKLTGVGCRFEQSPVVPMTGCRSPRGPRGVAAPTPTAVGPILGRPVRSTR